MEHSLRKQLRCQRATTAVNQAHIEYTVLMSCQNSWVYNTSEAETALSNAPMQEQDEVW